MTITQPTPSHLHHGFALGIACNATAANDLCTGASTTTDRSVHTHTCTHRGEQPAAAHRHTHTGDKCHTLSAFSINSKPLLMQRKNVSLFFNFVSSLPISQMSLLIIPWHSIEMETGGSCFICMNHMPKQLIPTSK